MKNKWEGNLQKGRTLLEVRRIGGKSVGMWLLYLKLIWFVGFYILSFNNFCFFVWFGLVWFVGFYGISTFVGYLTPNPFLCK